MNCSECRMERQNMVCSENASDETKRRFDPQRSLAWWYEIIRFLFAGLLAGPLAAEVWPTWRCQHYCIFCRVAGDRKATYRCGRPVELSRDELVHLIDDLVEMGAKGLLFSGGGEPRMNPHYLVALEKAHQHSIQCALFTNLGLLPKQQSGDPAVREQRQEEASRLVNCCELFIRCSLDAGSAATHERIHRSRPGEFEEILQMLSDLVKARSTLPADRPRPYLGVAYLAWFDSPANLHEIRPLAQRLKDLGVDSLQVRSSYTSTPEQRRQTQAVVDTCADLRDETFDVFATDYGLGHSDSTPRCWAAELLPLIMPGYLLPCSFLQGHLEYALPFGGSRRFRDLWWSKDRRDLFRNLDARTCPNCRFAAQNIVLNGFHRRFLGDDPTLERDIEAIIQRHNPRPSLI